ncbi:hypothetical protein COOONC_26978 [Cooperia oncophora]
MVGGHQIEEGPMIKVRDNYLSDAARERLGDALSDSLLNLTTDLRSPFAAFLLSLQLVCNIARIFDFRLPYLVRGNVRLYVHCVLERSLMKFCFTLTLSLMCFERSVSRELLRNAWFKFCQSVLSLGLHLGMPPENLHFNYPHSNIIEQARFVLEGVVAPKINENLARVNVHDRELISEWDICEDLDM